MKQFKKFEIGVSVHYGTPLPLMTYYKKKYEIKKNMKLKKETMLNQKIMVTEYYLCLSTQNLKIKKLIILVN